MSIRFNIKLLSAIIGLLLCFRNPIIADNKVKFDSLIYKSSEYINSDYNLCIKLANEAKKYLSKDIDRYVINELIGVASMFAGKDSIGIDIFNELEIYYNENNELFYLAVLYNDYGFYYLSQSNNELALDYFIKAKDLAININNNLILCSTYRNIANINSTLNNYKDAQQAYISLQELAKEINEDYYILYSLYSMSILSADNKEYDKSDSLLEIAINIINQSNTSQTKKLSILHSAILHKKGLNQLSQLKYDSAYSSFHKSINTNNTKSNTIIAYGNLGKLFIQTNRIDSAIKYLNYAKKIDTQDKYMANVYKLFGEAYIKNSNKTEAIKYLTKAYNLFLSAQNYSDLVETISLMQLIEDNVQIKNELIIKTSCFQDSINAQRIRLVAKNTESDLNIIHSYNKIKKEYEFEQYKFMMSLIFLLISITLILIIIYEIFKIKKQHKLLVDDFRTLTDGYELLSNNLTIELKTFLSKIFIYDEKNNTDNENSLSNHFKKDLELIFNNVANIINLLKKQKNKHL